CMLTTGCSNYTMTPEDAETVRLEVVQISHHIIYMKRMRGISTRSIKIPVIVSTLNFTTALKRPATIISLTGTAMQSVVVLAVYFMITSGPMTAGMQTSAWHLAKPVEIV